MNLLHFDEYSQQLFKCNGSSWKAWAPESSQDQPETTRRCEAGKLLSMYILLLCKYKIVDTRPVSYRLNSFRSLNITKLAIEKSPYARKVHMNVK